VHSLSIAEVGLELVKKLFRIGVVAPASPISKALAANVNELASSLYGPEALTLDFHPQCFLSAGHFAGTDAERSGAFIEMANDPDIDAIWFARGGYGSGRLLGDILQRLEPAALTKTYLGYSDMGALLSGLKTRGAPSLAHGPMPGDLARPGGEAAVSRALKWLIERDPQSVETSFSDKPCAAFNLITFSQIVGTPWQCDLTDHVLMLEEVSEYLYRVDRSLFHVTSNENVRRVKGIAMGRISDVPENDRPFGESAEEIFRRCCERAGLAFLGTADIGHDENNKVVPFGAPLTS